MVTESPIPLHPIRIAVDIMVGIVQLAIKSVFQVVKVVVEMDFLIIAEHRLEITVVHLAMLFALVANVLMEDVSVLDVSVRILVNLALLVPIVHLVVPTIFPLSALDGNAPGARLLR